jgi:hypothetical protein
MLRGEAMCVIIGCSCHDWVFMSSLGMHYIALETCIGMSESEEASHGAL